MKASDLFVKALENEGVDRIFAVPGEGAVAFIDDSEDGISLDARSSVTTQSTMLLEQAGRKYIAMPPDSLPRAGPRGAAIAHGIDNWKVTVWRR